MEKLSVETTGQGYDIFVGAGIFEQTDACSGLEQVAGGRRSLVITDTNVRPLYEQTLAAVLHNTSAEYTGCVAFEAGEHAKNLQTVEWLQQQAVNAGLDRRSVIIALGGGVVGDVAGFVAATYMRGIRFVQVPTTLLAMVDSSVGGKTAVDLPQGKNLVGAFHQPAAVFTDLRALESLPGRELRCGLAEVIKTAMLFDEELFTLLEKNVDALITPDVDLYQQVVAACCRHKANVVQLDERESGYRAILNYGHTFGHAIEAAGGYSHYNHGEAVAVGMLMASDLAADLGMATPALSRRQEQVFADLGLPTACRLSGTGSGELIDFMYRDKKTKSHQLNLVLPRQIGRAEIVTVDDADAVRRAIGGRLG